MTRIVRHDAARPQEVKVGENSVHICMCGLSKKKPFCDGSHKKCVNEQERKLYVYDKDGNMVEVGNEY
jgi:CDGSH-type Zn-finger protein